MTHRFRGHTRGYPSLRVFGGIKRRSEISVATGFSPWKEKIKVNGFGVIFDGEAENYAKIKQVTINELH